MLYRNLIFVILFLSTNCIYSLDWQKCNEGLEHESIISVASNNSALYATSITGGIYTRGYTSDKWLTFDKGLPYNHGKSFSLACNDTSIYFATSYGLYKNTVNIDYWSEANISAGNSIWSSLFISPNFIVYSADSNLLVSDDYGNLWKKVKPSLVNEFITTVSVELSNVIFATNDGNILKYFSQIDMYKKIASLGKKINSLIVNPGVTAIACTDSSIYVKYDDTTWVERNNGLEGNKINTLLSFNNLIYAATDKGVYFSKCDIDNIKWNKFGNSLPMAEVLSLSVRENILYAGLKDNGIYRIALELSSAEEEVNAYKIECNPNPIENQKLNLIASGSMEEISITDIMGNLVFTAKNINNWNYIVNLSHVASGVYFLNIRFANGSISKKLIKQ